MSEAVDAVGEMLNAFPNARDGVRGGWVGVMAKLLCDYPKSIALRMCDPIHGVTRECKFLPSVAEAVKWLEREVQSLRSAADWDQAAREQRASYANLYRSKEEIEARKAHVERINADLIAQGLPPIGRHAKAPPTLAEKKAFMTKYNISQQQWDEIPNQPNNSANP